MTTHTTLTHGGFLISKYTVVWGPRRYHSFLKSKKSTSPLAPGGFGPKTWDGKAGGHKLATVLAIRTEH